MGLDVEKIREDFPVLWVKWPGRVVDVRLI